MGFDRLRRLAVALPLIEGADLDRAEEWYVHPGRRAVLLGRLVPVVGA